MPGKQFEDKNVHSDHSTDDTFVTEFRRALDGGSDYAAALEKHVTGKSKIRRASALQTLQAISGLSADQMSELLMWARQQEY